jgi:hypothetical protein
MSPAPRETSWVTDEETNEAYDTSEELIEDERDITQGRVTWQERLHKNFRELTRMEPRGNVRPKIGTRCLVMVGNVTQDVGQMAQVTKLTAKMVEVKYRGARSRQLEHKMKQPSSLMMLETGLTMVQDAHGTVWICAQT